MVLNLFWVICFFLLGVSEAWAQGSLTPPGPPAPTMRTINEIEPRIPISIAGYTISNSGSYYLTTNLTATGHGINIYAGGVDLDLMGFSLSGGSLAGYQGVCVLGKTNSPVVGVTVRNGVIRNFGAGLRAEYGWNCRFENLILSDHVTDAIHLFGQYAGFGCVGIQILNCTMMNCMGNGIWINASNGGKCESTEIRDCTIAQCDNYGVYFYSIGGGVCAASRVVDCVISSNRYQGVRFEASGGGICRDVAIEECVIRENGSHGLVLMPASTSRCDGISISDCLVSGNGSRGVYLYGGITAGTCNNNLVRDCAVFLNRSYGVQMSGAYGTLLDGNHIAQNLTYGVNGISAYSNFVFRNSCAIHSTSNIYLNAVNTRGPYVSDRGALSTIAGTNSLSPWANFSR